MRYEEIKDWKDTDFKRLTGVKPETFEKMLAVLKREFPSFGRPPKMSRADQLLMTLMYWREYRTQFHIAGSYGISEATVCRTINKVEDTLVRSGEFRLPGKKVLQPSDTIIEVVLVDVSEQPIERPKKTKTALQWQKEASHPESTGDLIHQQSMQINATAFGNGSMHDFCLFKGSKTVRVFQPLCLADASYQGLADLHANSLTPKKRSKHHPLTLEQKAANRELARQRIYVEHVISKVKVFRILSERYRNRRKRFGLRFNLIASLYNLDLIDFCKRSNV